MAIDDFRLYTTLRSLQEQVSADEAGAIIDVARLAAMADGRTSIEEMTVLLALRRIITELAGGFMPHPTGAIDATRLATIGNALVATGARELAFSCAYLVMIHDLKLTTEEKALAAKLGEALVLDPTRTTALASEMEALVRQ